MAGGFLSDAAGELERSGSYLALVATEVEHIGFTGSSSQFLAFTTMAFGDHGALVGGDRRTFMITIATHLQAAVQRAELIEVMSRSTVDELGERLLAMSPTTLSLVLSPNASTAIRHPASPTRRAPLQPTFRQGRIGDCHLIAAMITLGRENPEQLTDLITANSNGTDTITFASRPDDMLHPGLVESLGLSTIDRPGSVTNNVWLDDPETPEPFKDAFGTTYQRLHQNHAFIVTDVDAASGTASVIDP